jgi:trk system potassium uptake protein TrkH
MLFRPDIADLRIIGLNIGRALAAVGLVMLGPAGLAFALGETNEGAAFVVAACVGIAAGLCAQLWLRTRRHADWQHGMVIAALSWVVVPFIGAIPLHLSGHYASFLDAYFDAMSGFATAGLAVINDVDHLAHSVNVWRHMMQFLGGQGLVLLMLSLFATGGGSAGMYVGEAREERIVPNVVRTVRIIWRISLLYASVGISALFGALLIAGVPLRTSVLHATTLFMAAFDTGGFAPTSASIWLYHSPLVEVVIAVLMLAGALSFALHYRLLQRRPDELYRNIETRILAVTLIGMFAMAAVGLVRIGAYTDVEALVRRGFFHIVSAQTGTGFNNTPSRLYISDWGVLAPAVLVLAMALGPMAGSTAGGIKLIRVGLVGKAIGEQVRRLALPPSAVTLSSYHSGGRQVLRENVVRPALTVLVLFIALYFVGAAVGLFYGYPLDLALFESTSASATVGLSIGITGPSMPTVLKITYILQMWMGRLEFMAVFALAAFVVAAFRGRV